MRKFALAIGLIILLSAVSSAQVGSTPGVKTPVYNPPPSDTSQVSTKTPPETQKKVNANCSGIKDVTDRVSGLRSIGIPNYFMIGKRREIKSLLAFIPSQNYIVFSCNISRRVRCVDGGNQMNILFRNGTRIELMHSLKFNCSGNFVVAFGGPVGVSFGDELQQLSTKEIQTIRIWGINSYLQDDLSKEDSKKLMNAFQCLSSIANFRAEK